MNNASVFMEDAEANADKLSPMDFIYQFWTKSGATVVGTPKSAFAFFDEISGKVVIYSSNEKCVENRLPPWTEEISLAFETVQEKGGVFFTSNGRVKCIVDGISVEGANYEEAAMRVMLMLTMPTL